MEVHKDRFVSCWIYVYLYSSRMLTKSGDGIHDSSLNYVVKLLCAEFQKGEKCLMLLTVLLEVYIM